MRNLSTSPHHQEKACHTVRNVLADFTVHCVRYVTDDAIAELNGTYSLVKYREMVENFVT